MRPTEPGYYWYLPKFERDWVPVELYMSPTGALTSIFIGAGGCAVTAMNGHWGGKLAAPKAQS